MGGLLMDVSVVTPSLDMLGYLKRCHASVADQHGVRFEHVVMDGGSRDGTVGWLAQNPAIVAHSGRDRGMYDAVNKGFALARGDIVAHLNCDEQLLPGALRLVKKAFDDDPSVDILFGDLLTIRPDGSLIAFRKTVKAIEPVLLTAPLYIATAATFYRRRVLEGGALYDESYKDVADLDTILRLSRSGYRFRHVPRYLAAFTMTGKNRSMAAGVRQEIARLREAAPWWVTHARLGWRAAGWLAKLAHGCYFQAGPIAYAVYADDAALRRTDFIAARPSFRWRTG